MLKTITRLIENSIRGHGGSWSTETERQPARILWAENRSGLEVVLMNFRLWALWRLRGGKRIRGEKARGTV